MFIWKDLYIDITAIYGVSLKALDDTQLDKMWLGK